MYQFSGPGAYKILLRAPGHRMFCTLHIFIPPTDRLGGRNLICYVSCVYCVNLKLEQNRKLNIVCTVPQL